MKSNWGKKINTKVAVPLAAVALVLSAGGGIVAAAHADSTSTTAQTTSTTSAQGQHERPAAVGKVTAVSGSTITLTDQMNNTTYTIDASNATIKKHTAPATEGTAPAAPTTITVSDIAVGDTLMVRGTVSGTSIAATAIDDGDMRMGRGGFGGMSGHGVHGTVTAVNGTTLTVAGQNGTTYTVDASSAKASKIQTISVSDVSVGDSVNVDGTVSGTSITAKRVMDGVPAAPTEQPTQTSQTTAQ